ncbi:MAG: DUF2924 domain-containing protein [Hyphomonas sp.]
MVSSRVCRESSSQSNVTLHKLLSLSGMSMSELRDEWRKVFDCDPPAFNRNNLEARLAYRIQELAYGGLSDATRERLGDLGDRLDGGNPRKRRVRVDKRPVAGTQLIRDWRGEEHVVTVRLEGFEWRGQIYKSLTSVARAITGTKWNGWIFFGLTRGSPRK